MKTRANEKIENDVINVVKGYLQKIGEDVDSLNLKTNLIEDYDLDSLDYLELFTSIEEKLDVTISNKMQDYGPLCSIEKLVEYIAFKKKND